ncbi:hypothetical protein PLICRDRAFT_33485 [Plicaturopsis crispa FD-325 SS-3]|nr:hypothetical protein PLICRDRAFT_33485 [Plicaturopsis crispa FD-325 SS-3]
MAAPNVRVVVRLPYNRPEHPLNDPPRIEWNNEKANVLWEVIARSRASESGGADWKGLAAHLDVPLPYLLYRAQMRYEEDLRGLQEVRGALTPVVLQSAKPNDEFPFGNDRPAAMRRVSTRNVSGSSSHLASSVRLTTPLGVRTRLTSLGHYTPHKPKKASSSSTLTLQGPKKSHVPLRPTTPSSSEDGTDSEDEAAAKEEEADRTAEEQEALDRKLKDLQKMMTNDALGLVTSSRPKSKKGKEIDRGRLGASQPQPVHGRGSIRREHTRVTRDDELSSRSQSLSSTTSPQGSIPSMPSPPPESQSRSPISRHISPGKSTSPPAVSPRSAVGRAHIIMGRNSESEQESTHGSPASSFSDISDASLSGSALESALMSNIRGGGSRLSAYARSRLLGRGAHH